MHVVFICTANICRSPMAEGIFLHRAREAGRANLKGTSMGTHGIGGQPAADFSRQVCLENGIDISAHRSRPIDVGELEAADLVLCMEAMHRSYIRLFLPAFESKTFLMGAWPGKEKRKSAVEDPIGAPVEIYRHVFGILDGHVGRILKNL